MNGAPEPHRIDVHAHYIAPAYREALIHAEMWMIGGIPAPDWSPELALAFMDAHGIQRQMLSVSDPGVEYVPADKRLDLARACNDYVASVMAEHQGRFGAFAVLPLSDPAAALGEAVRALDGLHLDGIGLLSSSEGKYLGDPTFEPLIAELARRGAWVFVHPTAINPTDKPSYQTPDFIAEYPFDTTRAIISLIFNGTFDRHPDIRWHFAHGGGTLPMLHLRLTALGASAKEFGAALGLPAGSSILTNESVPRALSGVLYDTALIADEPGLVAVSAMAGADRLIFGSDWPFAARLYTNDSDPQPALREAFDADLLQKIERQTALTHFDNPPSTS